jgi:myxalamid-type polyketide synthase MxaB
MPTFSSLIELLHWRAAQTGARCAYTFLSDAEGAELHITFGELEARAQAIAASLQDLEANQKPVMLFYPPGPDFIAAFWGCLYAGAIAVPVLPARLPRHLLRLKALLADAGARIILTTAKIRRQVDKLSDGAPELQVLLWGITDDISSEEAKRWLDPASGSDALAVLQYTSGSTAAPKGVMVNHGNLLHNLGCIQRVFGVTPESVILTWLPPYHDMGLVGGLLQPLYAGCRGVVMPPTSFLQRPLRWLEAITRYRATAIVAPNFAYDLCVRKVSPEQRRSLRLDSLEVALNAAEPIRHETLERFAKDFAPCGFRREAFRPAYGLAEATLLVSGNAHGRGPVLQTVQAAALEQHAVIPGQRTSAGSRTLVGCGQVAPDLKIAIIDPESLKPCCPGRVGEIWVAGPSIARGYWRRAAETEQTFKACLSTTGEGPFLRTGDLGFLSNGELFVTGRLKDLIIIRGCNHYPHDLELTAQNSHRSLLPGCGAAFSIEGVSEEHLVIIHEVQDRRPLAGDEVASAIRRALADSHEVQPHAVVLIKPRTIFRTSSGKIQRRACREAFLRGKLKVLYEWRESESSEKAANGRVSKVRSGLVWDYLSTQFLSHRLAGHGDRSAARPRSRGNHVQPGEPIAIIGIGCRFPGAENPHAFWRVLRDGIDTVSEVPPDRWDVDAFYDPTPGSTGKMSTRWGGFLERVDLFDPHFFGISPREAAAMDPQQRLLLEVTWEALENAGVAPEKLAGSKTGVFVGIGGIDYSQLVLTYEDHLERIGAYVGTGNAHSIAANRISYLLDLRGPSVAVDTACSSSLVALHLACKALGSAEADMALIGGVNLILTPELTIAFSHARMMAADGRCKTFDAKADGYVRGEGCGVVVLKRLSDAVRDRDNILALIRGSAVTQDGRTAGIAAPNALAQEAVIRDALFQAGAAPGDLNYIEAHGTGTSIGDPIEIEAIKTVLGEARPDDPECFLGSVKANIGHLENASGIAGLIKVVLCLRHREIPAQLHLRELNPRISLNNTRIVIPRALRPWSPVGRRLAGLSSFGFGGTNAHVVVEEAPQKRRALSRRRMERSKQILSLSARSDNALRELAGRFEGHLADHPDESLPDACFTANVGRSHFPHRLAIVAENGEEVRKRLLAFVGGRSMAGLQSGRVQKKHGPRIAFLFTGQGSQYAGMGRELYQSQPVFRNALEQCAEALGSALEQPLLSVFYPKRKTASVLNETAYTQPALFALEYALAELWRSWGIEPDAVLGHSVGEYVAATVSGVFGPDGGIKLIAERGRLMQRLPRGGAMAAVLASEERVAAAIAPYRDRVSIAGINGPENTTISGAREAIESVVRALESEGVASQALPVSHAFHSPLMDSILDEFEVLSSRFHFEAPRIPFISNLTGRAFAEGEVPGASYWRRHIRQAVRFNDGLKALFTLGFDLFLELGPDATLSAMGKRCLPAGASCVWLPSLKRGRQDWQTILDSLAALYVLGSDVHWEGFDQPYQRSKVWLPTYPFERERCWEEPPGATAGALARRAAPHPLLGRRLESALPAVQFENHLGGHALRYLEDHQIQGSSVLPAAAYLEMALAASSEIIGEGPKTLTEVIFHEAVILHREETRTVQLIAFPAQSGAASFQILSHRTDAEKTTWILNASGEFRTESAQSADPHSEKIHIENIHAQCPEEKSGAELYAALRERGLEYGPVFQGVERFWRRDGEALAKVRLSPLVEREASRYLMHPALLDSCLHVLAAALPNWASSSDHKWLYLPVGVGSLRFLAHPPARLFSHCVFRVGSRFGSDILEADIRLLDDNGRMLAELLDLRLKLVRRESDPVARNDFADWLYEPMWIPKALRDAHAKPRPAGAGEWVVFEDSGGVAEALAERIRSQGESCTIVGRDPGDHLWNDPLCRGVIHLSSLDLCSPEDSACSLMRAQCTCIGALHLVQAMAEFPSPVKPRLWLVTRGAQAVEQSRDLVSIAQAPLWGLARSIDLEHPELRCTRIDLAPEGAHDEVSLLFDEILAEELDHEVAFRRGVRYVARLVPRADEISQEARLSIPAGAAFRLDMTRSGNLENLTLSSVPRTEPGPGQVEIQVCAAGLNFRDVLNAMGLYPGGPIPFGAECGGTVTAVAPGVEDIRVGDDVIAIAAGSLGAFVIADAQAVVPKPAALRFEEAATIPITFLTAYYAFRQLGSLSQGERVLIHAAAGGVGLAAVQLAQQIGAEIFATAGTPEKRDFLRSLGVPHVMDSRSLLFAEEVMAKTRGEGVDVVLNSLSGEYAAKSLSTLGAHGRFVEIGKTDIYQNKRLGLFPFRNNLSYFALDLERVCRERPRLIRSLFLEIVQLFKEGRLQPLPRRVFSIEDVVEAFRYMARRKNIGKVVVSLERAAATSHNTAVRLRAEGTYLIAGGLGGLGLAVARWMVERGVRSLVLLGRTGGSADSDAAVSALRATGAQVRVIQADVSQEADMARAMDEIARFMPPLRGIIHVAGVIDDHLILKLEDKSLIRVMAPKVAGAWNLHALSTDLPLDFFVMFSSVASVLGSPGQANYSAANAFVDALAHYRRSRGLPALAINWGPWSEVGMAARLAEKRNAVLRTINPIAPPQGLEVLERLLGNQSAQVVVLSANWPELARSFDGREPPALLSELLREKARLGSSGRAEAHYEHFNQEAVLALGPSERHALLLSYIQKGLAQVMKLEPSELDPEESLNNLGLDSLMALELQHTLENGLGVRLPMDILMGTPSLNELVTRLLSILPPTKTEPAGGLEQRSVA